MPFVNVEALTFFNLEPDKVPVISLPIFSSKILILESVYGAFKVGLKDIVPSPALIV